MIVCIDAGHYDGSANGNPTFGYKEDEFTLDISKRMTALLSPYVTVAQTRTDGRYMTLNERVEIANACNASIFVSIHSNADSASSANGYEWWVYSKESDAYELAEELERESIPFLSTVSRGIKEGSFTVLARTQMPAVLIEHGFHTNEADVKLLLDNNYRDKVAYANSKAILTYLNIENSLTYPLKSEVLDDDTPSDWARNAWIWGQVLGITDGTDPKGEATREQVMTFLYRLYNEN